MKDLALGFGLAVRAADVDDDGDLDVYVANDSDPNYLYRNDGTGHFKEVGVPSFAAFDGNGAAQASMGIAMGDADGDGFLDMFVTAFSEDFSTLYKGLGRRLLLRREPRDRRRPPHLAPPVVGHGARRLRQRRRPRPRDRERPHLPADRPASRDHRHVPAEEPASREPDHPRRRPGRRPCRDALPRRHRRRGTRLPDPSRPSRPGRGRFRQRRAPRHPGHRSRRAAGAAAQRGRRRIVADRGLRDPRRHRRPRRARASRSPRRAGR